MVPYKEFANFIDAPVAGVILETGLNWLAFVVNLGALIGMTTVMLVQLYGQSRICYAMSRDGLFPKLFGEVHPKYRTPFKGTWFFGILTAIAGGFININVLFELVNIGSCRRSSSCPRAFCGCVRPSRTHTAASAPRAYRSRRSARSFSASS